MNYAAFRSILLWNAYDSCNEKGYNKKKLVSHIIYTINYFLKYEASDSKLLGHVYDCQFHHLSWYHFISHYAKCGKKFVQHVHQCRILNKLSSWLGVHFLLNKWTTERKLPVISRHGTAYIISYAVMQHLTQYCLYTSMMVIPISYHNVILFSTIQNGVKN